VAFVRITGLCCYKSPARRFGLTAPKLGVVFDRVITAQQAGCYNPTSTQPYFIPSFWTMTAINVCFLCMLVVGSIYLLRTRMFGVAVCNAVFAGEILYFISLSVLWHSAFSKNVSMSLSIAGATGVGNMALAAQLICGYPLIALCGLNLARRALNQQTS
jgi:hypothetical protein